MRFLSLLLLGMCALCDVCSHVIVLGLSVRLSYVGAVVAVNVMRVLLFVLHVNMVRECGGASVTEMVGWRTRKVWLW